MGVRGELTLRQAKRAQDLALRHTGQEALLHLGGSELGCVRRSVWSAHAGVGEDVPIGPITKELCTDMELRYPLSTLLMVSMCGGGGRGRGYRSTSRVMSYGRRGVVSS